MSKTVLNLTQGSITRHILTMAVPASIGYFFNTMYNFTDTFWAGQSSTTALAALSLSFPVYIIVIAFGSGIGSGVSGIISNLFGKNQSEKVKEYFIQSIILGLSISAGAAILLYTFMNPLFRLFHADGSLLKEAGAYTGIIIIGSPFFILNFIVNGLLNAAGDTKSFSKFLIAGFIINIFLDPLLLFGFSLGSIQIIPALGIPGIALATVLVQAGGTLYLFLCVRSLGTLKGVTRQYFIPQKKAMKEILAQGTPATLNMIIMAAGVFVITYYISDFGKSAIAAYGAAMRIEQIALIPTIGLNTALASLTGQNNGAEKSERITEGFKTTLKMGLLIFFVMMTPVMIFARELLSIFTKDPDVLRIGVLYLRIQFVSFYSYILLYQCGAVLQGIKRPSMILWTGIYRQIPAPFLFFNLFAFYFGLGITGIWWGITAVNWTAALILLVYTVKILRTRKNERTLAAAETI